LLKKLITHSVTERIIYRLEPVKIQTKDRDSFALSAAVCDCPL